MPKAITGKELNRIAGMIRDWPKGTPLNWEAICAGSKGILGYVPTRQALSGKTIVSTAYKERKEALRTNKAKLQGRPRPANMAVAMEIIQQQQEKIEKLEKTVTIMAEMAQRYIYNASMKGFTRSELEKPLKPLDKTPKEKASKESDSKIVPLNRKSKK